MKMSESNFDALSGFLGDEEPSNVVKNDKKVEKIEKITEPKKISCRFCGKEFNDDKIDKHEQKCKENPDVVKKEPLIEKQSVPAPVSFEPMIQEIVSSKISAMFGEKYNELIKNVKDDQISFMKQQNDILMKENKDLNDENKLYAEKINKFKENVRNEEESETIMFLKSKMHEIEQNLDTSRHSEKKDDWDFLNEHEKSVVSVALRLYITSRKKRADFRGAGLEKKAVEIAEKLFKHIGNDASPR